MIDNNLLTKAPDRNDELCSVIDLLYSFKQSLVFLRYKYEILKTDEERTKVAADIASGQISDLMLHFHNAYLESTLINVRAIDEFFRHKSLNKNRTADIDFQSVFRKPPKANLLDDNDIRAIGQLFAHITANRNANRVPKEDFDLIKLIGNTNEKIKETLIEAGLAPIRQEFENHYNLPYVLISMQEACLEAEALLEKEKISLGGLSFLGVKFNISGSNCVARI
jgi:hypothetical protein